MDEEIKEEVVEEVKEPVDKEAWVKQVAARLLTEVAPAAILFDTKQEILLQALANTINETLK